MLQLYYLYWYPGVFNQMSGLHLYHAIFLVLSVESVYMYTVDPVLTSFNLELRKSGDGHERTENCLSGGTLAIGMIVYENSLLLMLTRLLFTVS